MKVFVTLMLAVLFSAAAQAAELKLEIGAASRNWQSAELLEHPQARQIEIADDVSYKRPMSYRAVPLAALLTGVQPGDHIQAIALDGFAAELPAALLLTSRMPIEAGLPMHQIAGNRDHHHQCGRN